MEGKGEMTKPPIGLQDLRRSLYVKAKAEPAWRFWGLYVHVCKMETLQAAYEMAKGNNGAPGNDGVTFEAIEQGGVEGFLRQIRDELVAQTYRPMRARRKEIPKDGGKVRVLSIPSIRDCVVQGALKLILEPIFEADFLGNPVDRLMGSPPGPVSIRSRLGAAGETHGHFPAVHQSTGGAGGPIDQSDPSRVGELLRGGAFEPVLFVFQRLGGKEGPAASDASPEA
jgi:hypothetical protein